MKIVFFGSSRHVIPIVEVLNKDFELALIVTTEKEPSSPLVAYAHSNSISVLSVSDLADESVIRQITDQDAELGVVADFGIIIPKSLIQAFPKAIINIHPSLLPKHRGPTPVQTSILQGDKKTGITIIIIDEEVDHGPILYQEECEIEPHDTSETLTERLFQKGANSLSKTISEYIKDDLNLTDQIHKNATFTQRFTKSDGHIDLSKLEIARPEKPWRSGGNWKLEIDRRIRAYYPWPGVYTKFKIQNSKFKIIKLLPEGMIQVEGKRPMSYRDFANGYVEGKELLKKLGLD